MENIALNIGGRDFVFRVEFVDDNDSGAPWENAEGHGPVTGWETRDKLPGELVLNSDRGAKRFYDFAEACRMMKAGKWMKPVGNTLEHACFKGEWRCRSSSNYYATCNPYLHWKHIESKWIEVNP